MSVMQGAKSEGGGGGVATQPEFYLQRKSKKWTFLSNARVPLAPMIDNCIGDKEICDMWQAHYKTLLNNVKISSSKAFVERELHSIKDSSIVFRPIDIFNALKNAKTGKACGVDGLAAEHFIYADAILHVHLSLLFNCFITHGYLPREFMKTAIVPMKTPVINRAIDQLH